MRLFPLPIVRLKGALHCLYPLSAGKTGMLDSAQGTVKAHPWAVYDRSFVVIISFIVIILDYRC